MKSLVRLAICVVLLAALCGQAVAADYRKIKVAVLDFQQQGIFNNQDVGKIVAEWFTTSLVETGRFEVIERRLMQQIVQEQKMGASGLLDPASASRLGKLLGVKTVVTGTVQSYERTYELNVRLINVETGAIITADHVRAGSTTSLNDLVARMSARIIRHFPLDGYVVKRTGDTALIDLGQQAGVKAGLTFSVYLEGAPVRHPKTGEVLSIERIPKGGLRIVEVREKTALAQIVEEACRECIQAGQQVSSNQPEEALRQEAPARTRAEERRREEAERKEAEKRDKEARERAKQLDKEAREREKERLKQEEEERKRGGEQVSSSVIAGLAPLFSFPVQRDELRSLAVAPGGNLAASGDKSGLIMLWDLARGEQLGTLPGHLKGEVVALEFSADGRQLISAGRDKRVLVWDLSGRRQIGSAELKDTPTDIEISRSGRVVAIGSGGRESWLWDLRSNRLRPLRNPNDVFAVALSPDGQLLATAGQDKAIALWDTASGRQVKLLAGHGKDVRMLAFSANGRSLVSAGDDRLVMVWDLKSGVSRQVLRGHQDNVVHLAVSRDGQRIVSGERRRSGGLVIVWDAAAGQEVRRYTLEKRIDLLVMTPDGRQLLVGSGKELSSYRID